MWAPSIIATPVTALAAASANRARRRNRKDESRVTVNEDGRVMMTNYHAVKILTREGRALARAIEGYETDSGKVREMRAWLIRPSGEVKKYGKDETLDVADVDNDVYNEARSKIISAKDAAEPGAVFGYEASSEYRAPFNQLVWGFQERLPVVQSRLTVTLPAGWRADSCTIAVPSLTRCVEAPHQASGVRQSEP